MRRIGTLVGGWGNGSALVFSDAQSGTVFVIGTPAEPRPFVKDRG